MISNDSVKHELNQVLRWSSFSSESKANLEFHKLYTQMRSYRALVMAVTGIKANMGDEFKDAIEMMESFSLIVKKRETN